MVSPPGTQRFAVSGTFVVNRLSVPVSPHSRHLVLEELRISAGTILLQPQLTRTSARAASGTHNRGQNKYSYLIGALLLLHRKEKKRKKSKKLWKERKKGREKERKKERKKESALSLSFVRLICYLLLRRLRGYLTECALPEEHLQSQSERALRRGHRPPWCLTYPPPPRGRAPLHRALRSLVGRET